ncbi:MAG: aromatic ring-hydroxylating oxygenase subunit alpha [Steroidobacteraceae bacterium]
MLRALPPSWYDDRLDGAADRDRVFARHWQLVGHLSQWPEVGSSLNTVLGKVPIIVTRTATGFQGVQAICRHRAGPLEACSNGGRRFLRCLYHGWSYELDGRLIHAPEMAGATGFDPRDIRLPAIEMATALGLVFARLSAGPSTLADHLTGICERLARSGHDLTALQFDRRVSYDIDCNWKVYVDNYLEGYHVPAVHPGLNSVLDYRSYTTELSRWHSLQSSPLESTPDLYGQGEALYYFIYPNTMLNVLPGRLQTNRVLPLPHNRCRVEFEFFYLRPTDADRCERDRQFSDEIQREDISICEAVQRNLDSGAYEAGPLNPTRESGLAHFHDLLRADRSAP